MPDESVLRLFAKKRWFRERRRTQRRRREEVSAVDRDCARNSRSGVLSGPEGCTSSAELSTSVAGDSSYHGQESVATNAVQTESLIG
jgi:hypothetical protein